MKSKTSKVKKQTARVANNKTLHVELPGTIHKKLRVLLFLKELSMQKFVQLLAEKFVEGDTYLEDLVEERVREIKNKKIEKLKHVDEKDLYDVIEQNSPFKKDD